MIESFFLAARTRRRAMTCLALVALAGCGARPPAPIEHRAPSARAAPRPVPQVPPAAAVPAEPVAGPALGEGAVQIAPVRPAAPLEGRPLEARPSEARPSDARPSPGAVASGPLKSQPRGTKLPYSSAALARVAQSEAQAAAREAPAATSTPDVKPADPEAPKASDRATAPNGSTPAPDGRAAGSTWSWPARGELLQSFAQGRGKGIAIGGKAGDPVAAAADGRVIFSGVVRGYGNLVIVKHPGEVLSVYAHNRSLAVKEGETVRRGQRIAEVGNTDSDRVKLHFEIRRQGKPVDPLTLLPAR